MKIGIVGCGLIGKKRAFALENDDILIGCCDINKEIGEKFAKEFNCIFYKNHKDLISKCDIIIVSVVNKFAKKIVIDSLKKCHVLVEKPMGINHKESLIMYNESISNNKTLKIGFNHRFHPALSKAKEIFDSKLIGKLMFIRGIYGHGGRPGMENEWRSSKELCGGGELLDQGVHLIDLSVWFAGDIESVFGKVTTKYWNINVEDNVFMILQSITDINIQLQASWTNWKNTFQFEIFGSNGYLKINGLGGSYGEETLEYGKRKKEGGIPHIELFNFSSIDNSWKEEWKNFKNSIKKSINNGMDGVKVNQIIDAIYKSSLKNKSIKI